KHPAHERDRMVGPLRPDEAEAAHRVSLSLAKKAAAFRNTSRSSRRTRFSRRSRRNSSRSSLLNPSRRPASTPARLTHVLNDSAATPRSLAPSPSGRPARRYSSTASRRNSGGYGFLKFDPLGMVAHPSRQIGQHRPSAQMSTKAGTLQRLLGPTSTLRDQ